MRALITSASLTLVLFLPSVFAQNTTVGYRSSVPLSATVTSNGVQLNAAAQAGTVSYDVYRRLRNASGATWGTATNVTTSPFVYADVLPDDRTYEYKVVRNYIHNSQNETGYGYICAGKDSPASEWAQHADHYMGKVVVLLESTLAQALPSSSIQMLMDDLRADGWQPVLYTGVGSTDTPASVKSLIVGANAENDVRAVLLVGRVRVPIAHNTDIDPDGHAADAPAFANRLWPCDGYYGDLDGSWPVSTFAGADFNVVNFPSELELAVGRIDFSAMPAFAPLTESQLTEAYIQRAHDYRVGAIQPKKRSVVFDNITSFPLSASGYMTFGPMTGSAVQNTSPTIPLPDAGIYQPFVNFPPYDQLYKYVQLNNDPDLQNEGSYLWTHALSGGFLDGTGTNKAGTTEQFADPSFSSGGVFNLTCGSYLVRWHTPDNLLRAKITSGHALTSVWSGNPHWYFHNIGMGEPISRSVRQTMNNDPISPEYPPLYSWDPAPYGYANVHLGLMGDPTLRMHYPAPPAALVLSDNAGSASLSWQASPDAAVTGYHVYRYNAAGEPVLLNQAPVSGTSYPSTIPFNEQDAYMVRATRLETTPSGTYWNLSLGAIRGSCAFALDGMEHYINQNTTWDSNMNVRGKVIVQNGTTLTIDGATISFAASTPLITTNITVQPGGTLVVRNGAKLRNWMGCDAPAALWDGVKVLGNGTTLGGGLLVLESGAQVINAHTAAMCMNANPQAPDQLSSSGTGGRIHATNAAFINNRLDVFMGQQTGVDPLAPALSFFDHCTFSTTSALSVPGVMPYGHVRLFGAHNVEFRSVILSNTVNDPSASWADLGAGIIASHTTVKVLGGTTPQERCRFIGLNNAFSHYTMDPSRTFMLDRCDFIGNSRAVTSMATDLQRITNCTVDVPDGLCQIPGMGTNLTGASGFIFDENSFVGHGDATSLNELGARFANCGPEHNVFYNNQFNGFQGLNNGFYSAGTIISGTNAPTMGTSGLKIKCDDYAALSQNTYDVAFTKVFGNPNVKVSITQGVQPQFPTDYTAPAGNTFSLACDQSTQQHMHVNADATVNLFNYVHHGLQPGVVQLIPSCRDVAVGLVPSTVLYEKASACPTSPNAGVVVDDAITSATNADAEFRSLKEVYGDWSDGGNTEGLIAFIQDPANNSYAVRNQLMLVAPKVSVAAWKEVFLRQADMNPWHFAQALLANSPLEAQVLYMLDTSAVNPFFKELVLDGQNGGVSMHTLYQGEIEHFYGRKAGSLAAATGRVLHGEEPDKRSDVLAALAGLHTISAAERMLALHLTGEDLVAARTLVDSMLVEDSANGYWKVQDILVGMRAQNEALSLLSAGDRNVLEAIAADAKDPGQADAQAWLTFLGDDFPEDVEFPTAEPKSRRLSGSDAFAQKYEPLRAYPNPTNGPVYLVYQVPEGVEQVYMRMMDGLGRLVFQKQVAPQNGIAEVLPDQLANGLHVAALFYDGVRVGTVRLIVCK
jgi:hypothetical protein